jgi:hypothetical protein
VAAGNLAFAVELHRPLPHHAWWREREERPIGNSTVNQKMDTAAHRVSCAYPTKQERVLLPLPLHEIELTASWFCPQLFSRR